MKTPPLILIVDDNPANLDILQARLEANNYEIITAADREAGLAMAIKEKPDLISLDLMMPGEWGPRFYRKLRKDEELKDIPVIVVSGIDGDHAIRDAVAFVHKPFDPDKLIEIVKNTIG